MVEPKKVTLLRISSSDMPDRYPCAVFSRCITTVVAHFLLAQYTHAVACNMYIDADNTTPKIVCLLATVQSCNMDKQYVAVSSEIC